MFRVWREDRAQFSERGNQARSENRLFSSPNDAASANESNDLFSAMFFAARMNAPQATEARAEPTEMRRTPSSAIRANESSGLGRDINRFNGFGAATLTSSAISFGSRTLGA